MGRKRKQVGPSVPCPNVDWVYVTEIQINGRNVSAGTELKITGERGRYRFIRQVTTDKGVEWIDVWGGPKGSEQWRSFRVERVRRVHYKNQTIGNLAAEYKQKQVDKKAELEDGE
jgi:hypothetical protein